MNVAALRHQIDRWLDRLSPENLALVASFIEFLSQKQRQGAIVSQNNLAEVFSVEIQEMPAANSLSISEPSEIDGESQSKAVLLQDFRQAWHEAMSGQTISVAQMWEGIENEKELLELLEMTKIVELQMIEVGQMITAVDEKSGKRIGKFREAMLQKKEVSGVWVEPAKKERSHFVKKSAIALISLQNLVFQANISLVPYYFLISTSLLCNPLHNSYLSPTNK